MTIIIKDVPGLADVEVLEFLIGAADEGDLPISTGHGGFVVGEELADRFIAAYLIATGKKPAPTPVVVPAPAGIATTTVPAPVDAETTTVPAPAGTAEAEPAPAATGRMPRAPRAPRARRATGKGETK